MIPPLLRRAWHWHAPWGMRWSMAERVERVWQKYLVHWLIALIPRSIRYWVIIKTACQTSGDYPGEVTAEQMLRRLGG